MEILTKRLLLREFAEGDLAELAAYQAEPRYREFRPAEATGEHATELFDRFRRWAEERPRRNYQLAVARIEAPEVLIGNCGLRGKDLAAGTVEFGIEFAPQWWGQGYATEAARAILNFGFRELGLETVRGVTVTENARVTKLVERLGFTLLERRAGPAGMVARGWTHSEWQVTRERWEAWF